MTPMRAMREPVSEAEWDLRVNLAACYRARSFILTGAGVLAGLSATNWRWIHRSALMGPRHSIRPPLEPV